jgi:succinate-acetate transporter protein
MPHKFANPAPLGLSAFGMNTILLSIHTAGYFELSAIILGLGLLYGGIAQLSAGIMEFIRGNTFGTTTFGSYGLFWFSYVFLIYFNGRFDIAANEAGMMGWYLFMWGLFTTFMGIGTLNKNRTLQFVFASTALFYFLLALGQWLQLGPMYRTAVGYEGMVVGVSAFYLAMATAINETLQWRLFPIGEVQPGQPLKRDEASL